MNICEFQERYLTGIAVTGNVETGDGARCRLKYVRRVSDFFELGPVEIISRTSSMHSYVPLEIRKKVPPVIYDSQEMNRIFDVSRSVLLSLSLPPSQYLASKITN